MGGGLMQLVAYGAQDVYLTGNPQITFFKVVYRRHTNFAMEVIELTPQGNPDFGRRSAVTITRNGDLVTNMYLKVEVEQVKAKPDSNGVAQGKFGWVRRLGHALVNSVEVEIGGAKIDKQYGTWLDIWYELVHTSTKDRGYNIMIGDVPELTSVDMPNQSTFVTKPQYTMFIPLQFWFCRNVGLALPLIALQYHEVRLNIEFTAAERLCVKTSEFVLDSPLRMRDASLLVDYIYLDSEERRRYAQVGHEYLIEQLQFTGEESANQNAIKVKLGFNHPCKELVWAVRNGNFNPSSSTAKAFLGYTHDSAGWSAALQDAANNIAQNMFDLKENAYNVTIDEFLVCQPVQSNFGTYKTANHELSTPNWPGNYELTIVVTNLTGLANDDASFANWDLVLKESTLVSTVSSLRLDSRVQAVEVSLYLDDNGDLKFVAEATKHTLTIQDISLPLDYWTDTRFGTVGSVNPYDFRVWQWSNYGVNLDGSTNPVDRALIQLNGHDRFDQREGAYFNYVQPFQHHTSVPCDGVNVYSFAIHPEQHQPSGTANLSRIDNTQLNLNFVSNETRFLNSDTKLFVFAFSYNVLRIMSGMGGLAYSN